MAPHMDPSQWPSLSKIDPEFQKAIDEGPAPNPPPSGPAQVPPVRPMMEQMHKTLPYQTEIDRSGVTEETLDITVRDGTILTSMLYKPAVKASSPGPLAVLMHGGAFIVGAPFMEAPTAFHLVKKYGATVVSVKYRLAPEHVFPTQVNDVWDSLQWIAANASSLGADPSKGFILGGSSAGGKLATAMSLIARDEKLQPPLTGVSLVYPGVIWAEAVPEKFKKDYQAYDQNSDAPGMLNKETLAFMQKCYKPDIHSDLDNQLCWSKGHAGLPKTWIVVCGLDPLRDDGLLYERELRQAGVETRLNAYQGMPHGFDNLYSHFAQTKKFRQDREEAYAWMLGA